MRKRLIHILILSFVYISAFSQTEKQYNDTSYFIPFDNDFNLIMSASKGHINNVNSLLERKADINSVTVDGISSLMYATENGDIDMVRLLLKNNADPNLKPYNGVTALISACRINNFEIAEYLITNGAKLDLTDKDGATAFHYAAAYNYLDLVEMLIFFGADFNQEDKYGNIPLITAAYNNCLETVDLLLSNGVDINTTDKQGYSAIMVAAQRNNISIVELLLALGANINLVNNGGMTALSFAIKNENYEVVEKLVNAGADVNHKISRSKNLIELSKDVKDEEITELLITEGAKSSFLPYFNKLSVGTGILFSPNEFMNNFNADYLDNKYNTGINAGFNYRPAAIRMKTEAVNDTIYQFWERRFAFHTGLEKRFPLLEQKDSHFGPLIGVNLYYTFGNYRGSNVKPEALFVASPIVGWYYMSKYITLKAAYEYMDFGIPDASKGKFNLSIGFNINTSRKKLVEKDIPWLTY
ncbi:MAG: ankyrin repeat domain-containing protein [Bacteroidales bacterium]|nr:ankyrin repeat domain-containing protein [Bacteroidales bacterium]MCF8390415.1 ankyrin repeat domain-containing protein [Bacteroidales bacterium]